MPELNLNRFDALADLDNPEAVATPTHVTAKVSCCSTDSGSPAAVHRQSPKQHATLLVHDSSNQKACSVRVPLGSLKSAVSLVSFLEKKGLPVPQYSVFTMHEDVVPCQLHVIKPDSKASLLSRVSYANDLVLHLFNTHNDASSCVLHEFANVHPDCYKTLSECAEQPVVETSSGMLTVDFQEYLEAAFEASILTDAILYNDCDKVDMKAEWCTWNTGLVWKSSMNNNAAGYIYIFFKRSLSRVGKAKLSSFPLAASRQAKPWTMNKPKVISDVEQWLNGAPAPPPPPAHLIAKIVASKYPTVSCNMYENPALTSPSVLAQFEAALPSSVMESQPSSPASATSHPEQSDSWRKLGQVGTAASKGDKGRASRKKRNRKRSGSASRSEGSGPSTPTSPTQKDLEFFGQERFNSLVAILNQACNIQSRSCGWISSLSPTLSAEPLLPSHGLAEWWETRTDWGV